MSNLAVVPFETGQDLPAPPYGRFGRIVSTTGSEIVVLLDARSGESAGLQLGALVKVALRHSTVFGLVGELKIPTPLPGEDAMELRLAEIHLLGEVVVPAFGGDGAFHRGVSYLPSLDDVVSFADEDDARIVYALPGHETIRVGSIHQAPHVAAQISIDEMLGKHFAVLGTTGTGKSCSVTLILKQVLANHPSAHILMLDPHGEYGHAFGDLAYHLDGRNFALPYWMFSFDEIVELVFGADAPNRPVEIQYLRRMIIDAKSRFHSNSLSPQVVNADTPVPYSLGELDRLIDTAMGKLENQSEVGAYLRIKLRLAALRADRRFGFMFPPGLQVVDTLADMVSRIFRVPVDGKPITVFDLGGIPSEVLNLVVSVLGRMAFDLAFCSDHRLPILLVCEEAHRYAPAEHGIGFDAAKRALNRIAKEGRKYGLSLCIVTQRPSELDPTMVSQCSTVFALRMTNPKDQGLIAAALSEHGADLMSALPVLGTAQAIVTGEGVPVPMRIRFDRLPEDEQPRSASAAFSRRWRVEADSASFVPHVVSYWRQQRRVEGEALPPVRVV
jgi:DNA helicase HerA-like ATPase